MKKFSDTRVAKVLTAAFDVRRWSDFDRMKAFTTYLAEGFKRLFVPRKQVQAESFKEAMQQYNLTDAALLKEEQALFRLSLLMSVCATAFFAYAVYLFIFGTWRAVMLSLVVMMIAWALAFRYHFWYFQIKHRKLGCSFKEWFKQGLRGEQHE